MVRRQADHLRGRQVLARRARQPTARSSPSYTDNVTKIDTPDDHTVVIHTKQPDARIVGGLFIYILPKHIWGKVPVKDAHGLLPAEAAPGRQRSVHRHRVRAGPHRDHGAQPELPRARRRTSTRSSSSSTATRTPSSGRFSSARSTPTLEVQPPSFERLEQRRNIDDREGPIARLHRSWRSTAARRRAAPTRKFNPARPGPRRPPGHRLRGRPRAGSTRSPPRDTSFVGPRHPAVVLQDLLRDSRTRTTRYDPDKAKQILDDAGWQEQRRRRRGRRATRSSRSTSTSARSRRTTSRRRSWSPRRPRPGRDPLQRPGGQHGQALPSSPRRRSNGKPAPDFDTFIWGWGGDPYDPSFLLSILTTRSIGGSSDSFYSNPNYDRLFKQQAGEFDTAKRKDDHPADGRDHPARPALPGPDLRPEPPGLPDRRGSRTSSRPARRTTGDVICEQIAYAPLLTMTPGQAPVDDSGGGRRRVVIVAVCRAGLRPSVGYFVGAGQRAGASASRWSSRSEARP